MTSAHRYAFNVIKMHNFENQLLIKGSSDSDDGPNESTPLVDLRMIDFAHVFDGESNCLDENYIFGITNLLKTIELL